MEITLQRWGNSQGIRLSKTILKQLGINDKNATFEVEIKDKKLILNRKKESKLAQRFENFDYNHYWNNWNKEHPKQTKELNWGKAVGKEVTW